MAAATRIGGTSRAKRVRKEASTPRERRGQYGRAYESRFHIGWPSTFSRTCSKPPCPSAIPRG